MLSFSWLSYQSSAIVGSGQVKKNDNIVLLYKIPSFHPDEKQQYNWYNTCDVDDY